LSGDPDFAEHKERAEGFDFDRNVGIAQISLPKMGLDRRPQSRGRKTSGAHRADQRHRDIPRTVDRERIREAFLAKRSRGRGRRSRVDRVRRSPRATAQRHSGALNNHSAPPVQLRRQEKFYSWFQPRQARNRRARILAGFLAGQRIKQSLRLFRLAQRVQFEELVFA
jgi:hypothetical protein